MGNYLKYKNYYGSVEFRADENIFYGKVIDINDLVTYEAKSVNELKKAFLDSLEDYLQTCKDLKKEPTTTTNIEEEKVAEAILSNSTIYLLDEYPTISIQNLV